MTDNLSSSVWLTSSGLGTQDILLWRLPYNLLTGLIGIIGFDSNVADKFLIFWPIIFILPICSFLLAKNVVNTNVGAFVASIVFTFNTYFLAISTQGHLLINIASGFAVLSLVTFIYALEKRQISYFILTSIGLFITGFYDFRVLYIIIAVLSLYFIFYISFIQNGLRFRAALQKLIPLAAICLTVLVLLNLYWVLALIAGDGLVSNTILERTLFGNHFWSLFSAITLFHPFWTGGELEWFKVQPLPIYFWLIPLFAFMGLYLNRENKKVLFFGIIALLGILLSKQVAAPFADLYPLLHENIPGFNAFREASKFYLLTALGYSVLIGAFIDWLWRNWNKIRWQKYGKYPLTFLVICLFLWNAKPIITGEIGTQFVPRDIPKDYLVLKDFLLKQPEYFRTYWVPRESRWGIYTNDHPKISGVDVVQSDWRQFVHHSQQSEGSVIRNQIVDIFKQPYGKTLLSGASVKYVIVPTQDKENDDDFFVYYGYDRQFFIDTLDKTDYLKRIDIGTKKLVVYENKDYKPSIGSQSTLVGLDTFENLGNRYDFLRNNVSPEPSFYLAEENKIPASRLINLFDIPVVGKTIGSSSITDTFKLQKSSSATLYKNSNVATLSYDTTNSLMEITTKAVPNIILNSKELDSFSPSESKTLDRFALKENTNYILRINDSVAAIEDDTLKNLGRIDEKTLIELRTTEKNLISNPSFESELWQRQVGDCSNYDKNGKISMSLNKDKQRRTNGQHSLQLDATRHVACTDINIRLDSTTLHLLSFDYLSPNSKHAGYALQFNDAQKTIISAKMPIQERNKWQTFTKNVDVPAGATQASLTVYAYESDKLTRNTVYYDNFNFSKTELDKIIKKPSKTVAFEQANVSLRSGDNTFELKNKDYTVMNIIENSSFEAGLWNNVVGDCHAYDNNPQIAMKLQARNKTEGNQSLQLEATRHNACTGKDITLGDSGNYLLSFDVQGQNAKQAGYNLQFNDDKKTVLSEKIDIKKPGEWQKFKKKIAVPTDATNASLAIYAYETDGKTRNIVRYDNFKFIKIPDLDDTFYVLTKSDVKLQTPKHISHQAVNPTQKSVAIEGAIKPFSLTFAENFHPGWKLYLRPIDNKPHCDPVKTHLTYIDKVLSNNTECQSKQRFMQSDELSYLWQKPVFDDKHFKLNGYANGWIVDPSYIKDNYGPEYYQTNPDGSIDINMVMYFRPQSNFYIGLTFSGLTLLSSFSYLLWSATSRKRRRYTKYNANPISRRKLK